MTPLFSRDLHAAQKAKMIGIDGRDRQPCRIRTKTRTNNKGSASFGNAFDVGCGLFIRMYEERNSI